VPVLQQYVLLRRSYGSAFFSAAVTAVRSGQYSVLAQYSYVLLKTHRTLTEATVGISLRMCADVPI